MHALLTLLAQSTTPTTAAKSTRSSGSYVPLLIIIGVFAVVYFGFLRPRQQRLRQQQTAARELGIGDEVVSAGGIYGRVVALDANEVEVEVAPGVVLTFLRRAISPRTQGGPAGGAGRGFGGAPTRGSQPVDEPWERDPDGPGDTAGAAGPGDHGDGRPGSGTGGSPDSFGGPPPGGDPEPPAPGPTGA